MDTKEIGEIKRRCRRDRTNMTAVYGCYVRENGEIISDFRYPLATMPENEADKYMALFKKTLSGTPGRTLRDICFKTKQVADREERYALLFDLRKDGFDDDGLRNKLYQNIIQSVHLESDYLILLGHDTYDVPFKCKDGDTMSDASEEAFTFIQCAICPVKQTKPNLHYEYEKNAFKDGGMINAVNNPVIGFMFPAFDNRATNIYGALMFNKDTADSHADFVETIFGTATSMAPDAEKSCFDDLLAARLDEECSLAVVQALHEVASDKVLLHKESKAPETLTVDRNDIEQMLASGGASPEKINEAGDAFDEAFGMEANVKLENIVDVKHFVIKTPDAQIKMDVSHANDLEIRTLGGINYLMIPVDDAEVNGIHIHLPVNQN